MTAEFQQADDGKRVGDREPLEKEQRVNRRQCAGLVLGSRPTDTALGLHRLLAGLRPGLTETGPKPSPDWPAAPPGVSTVGLPPGSELHWDVSERGLGTHRTDSPTLRTGGDDDLQEGAFHKMLEYNQQF